MANTLDHLFSSLTVRRLVVKNRIFSSGHMTVMLKDGLPSDDMIAYHQARAKGGAGLIIIEAARAHASGMSGRPAIRAFDDACIPGYRRIVQACHPHGCKVFAQLSHPGREMTLAADGTHAVAFAPSAIPNERFHVMPREMPVTTIHDITAGFKASAIRLRKAGLDGIEVVASHGYLLGQFMNPRVNQRSDPYGGCLENRLRFTSELLRAVREGAGDDMVIGMRFSAEEKDHDGLEPDEAIEIARALSEAGLVDYLNVTAGTSAGLAGSTHIVPPMAFNTAYVAPLAATIKANVGVPVFVAGRINQPQIAETVLSTGQADMCAMTRAMISDPDMPRKAEAGLFDDIRACVACNQACIGHMLNGYPISCIQRPETGRELTYGSLSPADHPRKVMVIGAGPGGMKAAAIAAGRGHDVTLFEASDTLGGQVNLAQSLPGRAEFGGVITNLTRELEREEIQIVLNTCVTRDTIDRFQPDALIIATGAQPYMPDIEGADEAHVVDAWQVLHGEAILAAAP